MNLKQGSEFDLSLLLLFKKEWREQFALIALAHCFRLSWKKEQRKQIALITLDKKSDESNLLSSLFTKKNQEQDIPIDLDKKSNESESLS